MPSQPAKTATGAVGTPCAALAAGDPCPRCNRPLVLRTGFRSGRPHYFLGCAGYPGCRFTQGIALPQAKALELTIDKEVIEKARMMTPEQFAERIHGAQKLLPLAMIEMALSDEVAPRDRVAAFREFFRVVPAPKIVDLEDKGKSAFAQWEAMLNREAQADGGSADVAADAEAESESA